MQHGFLAKNMAPFFLEKGIILAMTQKNGNRFLSNDRVNG
jgi:hypothetical protein